MSNDDNRKVEMRGKNLLLCFDAFGTLFVPRKPVHQQYAEVARSLGVSGFKDEDIQASFKNAFKMEAKQNPNYGKANGMNAEKWWSNIINNTFQPLIEPGQKLPAELVPRLLHRFWCDEGYTLFPDAQPFIHRLRQLHRTNGSRVVIGVITNSDDRVPDVLTALGLRVSSLRYGRVPADAARGDDVNYDVDFSVMSYDVGHEKPDKRIFLAAEEMLQTTLRDRPGREMALYDPSQWQKVYIGDEYNKDVVGALGAGWDAILVDRASARTNSDLEWLDGKPIGNLSEQLQLSKAVSCSSLATLSEWLSP